MRLAARLTRREDAESHEENEGEAMQSKQRESGGREYNAIERRLGALARAEASTKRLVVVVKEVVVVVQAEKRAQRKTARRINRHARWRGLIETGTVWSAS